LPWRKAGVALGQFALLAVAASAVVGWEFLRQRFEQADPYAGRREMLRSSLEMVRERPWTGFGLGTWPAAYPQYAYYDDGTYANQAHNDWAQWAVEGGIPLLAMMVCFAAMLARPAARSLWGVGLLAVLAHCLVDYPMQQRPALAGWFFAMAGAVAARAAAGRGYDKQDRTVR
jgi:O-antigen ligase